MPVPAWIRFGSVGVVLFQIVAVGFVIPKLRRAFLRGLYPLRMRVVRAPDGLHSVLENGVIFALVALLAAPLFWMNLESPAAEALWVSGIVLVFPYAAYLLRWLLESALTVGQLTVEDERARLEIKKPASACEIDLAQPFRVAVQWSPRSWRRNMRVQLHVTQGDSGLYLWWELPFPPLSLKAFQKLPTVGEVRGAYLGRSSAGAEVSRRLKEAVEAAEGLRLILLRRVEVSERR